MQAMFLNMLSYMPWVSCAIALILIIKKLFPNRFKAKLYKAVYILLALRIVLPFDFSIKNAPLSVTIPIASLPVSGTVPSAAQIGADIAAPFVERSFSFVSLLPIIWLIGAVISATVAIIPYLIFTIKLHRTRQELHAGYIYNALGGKVKLYVQSCIPSPMIMGFMRCSMYIPHDAADANEAQIIVNHELCHKHAGDLWAKLLFVLARSVAWFNPLMYLMANDAQLIIENACDEAVLNGKSVAERREYGQVLLASYIYSTRSQYLCAPFSRGGKNVKKRFAALLDNKIKKRGTMIFSALLCFTLLASVCISCTAKSSQSTSASTIPPAISTVSPQSSSAVSESSPPMFESSSIPIKSESITQSGNDNAVKPDIHLTVPTGSGDITMQNPLSEGTITSKFGNGHRGIDIAAPKDTPIYAVADGEVLSSQYNDSNGNVVTISHGEGVLTYYAHANTLEVKPGDKVKAGDLIATVGSTGNATGNHLHFEVYINDELTNPEAYIKFN
ncbi:MAG: M56 family metallopeptidase [Oscillospiraceae bacterium]